MSAVRAFTPPLAIKRLGKNPCYFFDFEVRGRGHFPFDMLRYDTCYPIDPDSVSNLDFDTMEIGRKERSVRLRSWGLMRNWEPTAARWSSFGWYVVREGNEL